MPRRRAAKIRALQIRAATLALISPDDARAGTSPRSIRLPIARTRSIWLNYASRAGESRVPPDAKRERAPKIPIDRSRAGDRQSFKASRSPLSEPFKQRADGLTGGLGTELLNRDISRRCKRTLHVYPVNLARNYSRGLNGLNERLRGNFRAAHCCARA